MRKEVKEISPIARDDAMQFEIARKIDAQHTLAMRAREEFSELDTPGDGKLHAEFVTAWGEFTTSLSSFHHTLVKGYGNVSATLLAMHFAEERGKTVDVQKKMEQAARDYGVTKCAKIPWRIR
ncbi:hypothetical protein [Streptomyces sp. MAR4 CNX-425]|uniref:hypothetical protein n=1 Tax=Streptomyces sp. MAR4 CNX-425 TaxID=3406343 RepID=UPI003B5110D8